MTDTPRIVIVGAGAAGIAAASRLIENGFTNIVILEAEDRIGGRIWSVQLGNDIVDLGAQVCVQNSLVPSLVKDFDLLEPSTTGINLYHSKHGRLADEFVKTFFEMLEVLYFQEKPEISWEQQINEQYENYVAKYFNSEMERYLSRENFNFVKRLFLLNSCVCPLSCSGHRFSKCVTSYRMIWKNSSYYRSLFDILMKKDLKVDEKILCKSEVTNIDWHDADVKLTCSDGSTYTANCALVTIPLGALREKSATLFSPPLPEIKRQAIELLGFAAPTTLVLHFPKRWWNDSDMLFSWAEDDIKAVDFKKGPSKDGQSWLTNIVGLFVNPTYKNCLTAMCAGELVREIELIDDDTVLDGIDYVSQKFLGGTFRNICKPTKLARGNWYNNPHFRGTVTTETLETKRLGISRQSLAEPVLSEVGEPKLLFAGEATTDDSHDFANGAVFTGFREADRIINMYRHTC